jgi:hypothetical protein
MKIAANLVVLMATSQEDAIAIVAGAQRWLYATPTHGKFLLSDEVLGSHAEDILNLKFVTSTGMETSCKPQSEPLQDHDEILETIALKIDDAQKYEGADNPVCRGLAAFVRGMKGNV